MNLVMMWWVAFLLVLQAVLAFRLAFKPPDNDVTPFVATAGSAITCLIVMPPAIWFFVKFWDVLWGAS